MPEHRESASAEIKAFGEYAYFIEKQRVASGWTPRRGEMGWERYQGCTRKIRYHEAPDVAGWMRSYRCNFCEGYHITSKLKKNPIREIGCP